MEGHGPFTRRMQRAAIEGLCKRRAAIVERLDTLAEFMADWEAALFTTTANGAAHALGNTVERRRHEMEIRDYVCQRYGDSGGVRVRAIFWTGSRAMGCASAEADWDWTVVLDGYQTPLVGNVESYISPRDGRLVDLNLCETGRWLCLAAAGTLWVVPYLWALPADYILFCDEDLLARHEQIKERDLPLPRLKEAAIENAKSNLGVASTEWQQGNIRKAKKRLVYVVRHLDFACQVGERNQIVEYGAGAVNDIRVAWLRHNFGTWDAFKEVKSAIACPCYF